VLSPPCALCKLQISDCRGCQSCHGSRKPLHAIARWEGAVFLRVATSRRRSYAKPRLGTNGNARRPRDRVTAAHNKLAPDSGID
jgi:hypothetical protein